MKTKTILLSGLAIFAVAGASFTAVNIATGETAIAQASTAKAIVDKAIDAGSVGETAAGYLALTGDSASSEVVNAMNEVNAGRKSVYTRLARQQNVQVDVVAALTGEKQIANSAQGTKVLNKQGKWVTVQ